MSDATRRVLDVAKLAEAVTAVARHRKISMRDVSAETGLSPSTLTRLVQGQKPDADGLVTLLAWLNADAAEFAVVRDDRRSGHEYDRTR
jgi:transcriptional regulator with XRE-family HTH domain